MDFMDYFYCMDFYYFVQARLDFYVFLSFAKNTWISMNCMDFLEELAQAHASSAGALSCPRHKGIFQRRSMGHLEWFGHQVKHSFMKTHTPGKE